MKQTLILGNIITMDEKRPTAGAALVKDGLFAYIGDVEEAKRIGDAEAEVLDYGDNYIYPGFLEAHSHGHLAGVRAIGQAENAPVNDRLMAIRRDDPLIHAFLADYPYLKTIIVFLRCNRSIIDGVL